MRFEEVIKIRVTFAWCIRVVYEVYAVEFTEFVRKLCIFVYQFVANMIYDGSVFGFQIHYIRVVVREVVCVDVCTEAREYTYDHTVLILDSPSERVK